jgi:hypothetical protein
LAHNGHGDKFLHAVEPRGQVHQSINFVIEKEITEHSFLFVEYVGDYPVHGGTSHLFNSGGGYRITDNQQIDFHIGFGLNRNAPTSIFGIGYSFRLDRLFDGFVRPFVRCPCPSTADFFGALRRRFSLYAGARRADSCSPL